MGSSSFRFRLERVRALRERSEDAAKQALAEALQHHRLSTQAMDRAQAGVARARAAQLDAVRTPTSVAELLARQAFLERSERAVEATRQDVAHHEQQVERRREELTAAARERQALERLKEHRRRDHEREQARREELMLDEIALNGFRRRPA